MRNVFVEGIQGMGKSTLVNAISKEFPQYHVCREWDYSPIDLAWCTWMTKEEYENTLEKYKEIQEEIVKKTVEEHGHYVISYLQVITDIPNFHKDLEAYEIYNGRKTFAEFKDIIFTRFRNFKETGYLFECSFFQNIIEDLVLFHQLSDDEIIDFYRELYNEVNMEEFLLLYLYSDKLEEHINAIKKERSDHLGNEMWYQLMLQYLIHSPYGEKHQYKEFKDMIAHFKHRQQLELRIMKEVVGDRAIVLEVKEWKMEEIKTLFE